MNWIDAWPLLLIFAAGIALGRWIERRRAQRIDRTRREMSAAVDGAAEKIREKFGKK